ncbi:HAD family hydrolase [Agromyces albus]|uniref:HAD family hydrolase n=1 Tax=Agromyces albus TaxID=205332 RepID=UPI0027803E84|nr:HAD hydrolase family protein [Agromyces albus]MDQ0577739.1 hydroxymethylpyrimidine pyrophosphatase-like HAD family hydrolase [Agromyces albus]
MSQQPAPGENRAPERHGAPASQRPHAVDVAPDGRWLVVLDVDGTIMHEDESIDQVVADAVAAVRDRGHEVTLATGRSWATTHPVLERLGLTPEYVVCANGAITMRRDDEASDGYVRAHVETFDPTEVLERIRSFLPDGRFMVEEPNGFRLYTEGMSDWNLDNAREVPFEQLLDQRATRVVVVSPDHELEEFLSIVEEMGLHQVSYAIGWTAWLDIAPEGVSKATALERVRGWLDLPVDRVIAIGDGRNDIEMFTWAGAAGRSVAMGQAPAEVREAAGEVTGDIDHAGLASVLDSLS